MAKQAKKQTKTKKVNGNNNLESRLKNPESKVAKYYVIFNSMKGKPREEVIAKMQKTGGAKASTASFWYSKFNNL